MQVTFGEWVRWQLARQGMDRSAAATALGISTGSITNIYRRAEPDGVNDVTLSRLAVLLEMTEPELMTAWRKGLPATAKPPSNGKTSKAEQSKKGGKK